MSGSGEPPSAGDGARAPRLRSFSESWVGAVRGLARVSSDRRVAVLDDVLQGSQPTLTYYALLGISEVIAGLALILNSDATLIGANIVAPLMTPIFGIALGLARADLTLLRTALVAEFGGAMVGVVLCFGLGLLPFAQEVTPALLAQTRPTLIDLAVAALAGTAGALAMIDDRISPALPGVAIATALNPPIAAIGLSLALGAYAGAWGAFLLFFANVLAILAVAGVTFVIAGFVTRQEIGSFRDLARRFAVAAIGLLVVTVLLTGHLTKMVRDLRIQRALGEVLNGEFAKRPSTALASVEFDVHRDGVEVLSEVRTPRVIEPPEVQRIQDALAARLGSPVRLFVRCATTTDVAATGSTSLRPYLGLDGKVSEAPIAPEMRLLQVAEQVTREVAAARPEIVLLNTDLTQTPAGPVFVVSVETPRNPEPESVARFEAHLRERLGHESLRVVVRRVESVDITSKGRILFGAAHFADRSADERARAERVEGAVRDGLAKLTDVFPTAVDAVRGDRGWVVRAEVVGPRVPTPKDVTGVESGARAACGEAVSVSLLARAEVVVEASGYGALGARR